MCDLSGLSDATIRRAERSPANAEAETLRAIVQALATAAPLSLVEATEIAGELGWTLGAVEAIAARADAARPASGGQGRARIDRALGALEDVLDPLGDVMDALSRLCTAVGDRAQTDILRHPDITALLRTLAHTHVIELSSEHDPDGEPGAYRFVGRLPAEIRTESGTQRVAYFDERGNQVVLPTTPGYRLMRVVGRTERLPDGSLVEHFDYYTPEGARLVPIDDLPRVSEPKPAKRSGAC